MISRISNTNIFSRYILFVYSVESNYSLYIFFAWLVDFKKGSEDLKFYDYLYFSSTYLIKIRLDMDEQEKKRQRIYYFLNARNQANAFCLQSKEKNFLQKNNF